MAHLGTLCPAAPLHPSAHACPRATLPCLTPDWYLEQLSVFDALLRRLRFGSHLDPPPTAVEQLQATMERLGLSAAELSKLASGEAVSGAPRAGL